MAEAQGFEPWMVESKSTVLDRTRRCPNITLLTCIYKTVKLFSFS